MRVKIETEAPHWRADPLWELLGEGIIDVCFEAQRPLGTPGTDAGAPIGPLVKPDALAQDFTHPRPVPRHQLATLMKEVLKLEQQNVIELVPSNGRDAPEYKGQRIFLHPFVFAPKAKPPDAPADWEPVFRVCLDVSRLNPFLEELARTRLPKTRDIVNAHSGMAACFNLDLWGAYHQREIREDARHFFGFRVQDPDDAAKWRFYIYRAGFFGLATLPGLFQAGIEAALDGVKEEITSLSTLTVYIDNLDGSVAFDPRFRVPAHRIIDPARPPLPEGASGAVPLLSLAESRRRWPLAWDDVRKRFLALFRATMRALDKDRYCISLAKTRPCSTWSRTMGLIMDGVGHMIDPERVVAWTDSMVRPEIPTLAWLQGFLGICTYSLGYLNPRAYVESTHPLISLSTEASRLARERDRGARSFVADRWAADGALEEAYQRLRLDVLHSAFVAHLREGEPVFVRCDASETGAAAVAGQFDQQSGIFRIAYIKAVRFSSLQQARWSTAAKEVFGWVQIMRAYWRELAPFACVFQGDHANATSAAELLASRHVHRWVSELMSFVSFRYRESVRGLVNKWGDFGSRYAPSAPLPEEEDISLTGEALAEAAQRILDADAAAERPPVVVRAITRARAKATSKPAAPMMGTSTASSSATAPRQAMDLRDAARPAWAATAAAASTTTASASATTPAPITPVATPAILGLPAPHEGAALETPELVDLVGEPVPNAGTVVDHRHEAHPSPFLLSVAEAQRVWAETEAAEAERVKRTLPLARRTVCGLNLWLFKDKVYVPSSAEEIVNHIIDAFHRAGGSFSAHQSAGKAQMMLNASAYHVSGFAEAFQKRTASCACKLNVRDAGDAKGGFLPMPQFGVRERVMLDWAAIPVASKEGYDHVCVATDTASRLVSLYAMKGAPTGADSAAVLADWVGHADFPLSVSTDGGSHFLGAFRDYCEANKIVMETSTPYHSAGRSPVERLVGTVKAALLRVLAHGKTSQWGAILSALQRALNATPHLSLAGLTPFQVWHGPDLRPLLPLEADGYPGAVERHPAVAAAMGAYRAEVRAANRSVAAMASEMASGLRAAQSASITLPSFEVGAYVLMYAPGTRQHSLQSPYVGPCKIVARGVNTLGAPTGFYALRECLPGHSPSRPEECLYDKELARHVSDLRPFEWGARSWVEIMETRLPEGYGFVEEVLRGPDDEGRYECRFTSGLVQWLRQSQMSAFSTPLKVYLAKNEDARAKAAVLRAAARAAASAARTRGKPSTGGAVTTVLPGGGMGAVSDPTAKRRAGEK